MPAFFIIGEENWGWFMRVKMDNGGRRSGGDRRSFSYTVYLPERRSDKDRRISEEDRRQKLR